MAILSISGDGLQNSLDKLKVYCYKWYLELNTTKTTIIVFNTTGRLLKRYRFPYNGKILEQVREFKYLGTTLSGTVNLMCEKEQLQKQANKAYFPMFNYPAEKMELKIAETFLVYLRKLVYLALLGN